MNRILILNFTIIYCLGFNCFGQNELRLNTLDELGEAVFNTLHDGDFEEFKSLIITEKEWGQAMNQTASNDSSKHELVEQLKWLQGALITNTEESFNNIRNSGLLKGLEWNNIELLSVNSVVESNEFLESGTSLIIGRYKSQEFSVSFNCCKSDVWFVCDQLKIAYRE